MAQVTMTETNKWNESDIKAEIQRKWLDYNWFDTSNQAIYLGNVDTKSFLLPQNGIRSLKGRMAAKE